MIAPAIKTQRGVGWLILSYILAFSLDIVFPYRSYGLTFRPEMSDFINISVSWYTEWKRRRWKHVDCMKNPAALIKA